MYPIKTLRAPLAATLLIILTGCTVHPQGESQERLAAKQQGAPYVKPFEHRPPTTLPANPTPDDLVRVALLNNADLEQKYWDWRSAIEQITQDGTEQVVRGRAAQPSRCQSRGRALPESQV